MLCNFLGEPTFQQALRNYLKKYQYSNAETKDLWDALSAVSDHVGLLKFYSWFLFVCRILMKWCQAGRNRWAFRWFLFLNKSTAKIASLDYVNIVSLRVFLAEIYFFILQIVFFIDGGEDPENQIWQIPINICTASSPSEPKFKVLFTGREKEITISGIKPDEWVKVCLPWTYSKF